jgi:iron complex outermembrane receptor protein
LLHNCYSVIQKRKSRETALYSRDTAAQTERQHVQEGLLSGNVCPPFPADYHPLLCAAHNRGVPKKGPYSRARDWIVKNISKIALRGSAALQTLALVGAGLTAFASPAFAQEPQAASEGDEDVIVVTGSILRQTDRITASPVSTLTSENLDKRGVSTVQDAIQTLAANNGPALTNSFSANGAFAAGASAVSLRGLSTNSTLVLFDGLRAAYYPLADDGSRNFVDLNTIPDDIVERIDILRDGASSAYGADAIAGVVNIITKKQVKGISGRMEGGISSRGDAGQYRLTLTAGMGDLDENGYNAYISGFYYQSKLVKNSQRGYPYNSDDLRNVCYEGTCGGNGILNGLDANGAFAGVSTGANFMVRPYSATDTNFATPLGRWQNLDDCGVGTSVALTPAQQGAAAPSTVCQYDLTKLYGVIQPNIQRFGVSARFTGRVSDSLEAYAEFNFLQSKVDYTGFPGTVYNNAPTGIYYPQFSTASNAANRAPGSLILSLPVYVCPERVNCATSANRTLNPNNPFAAQGQVARLIGRDMESVTYNETRNRAYRAAFGLSGSLTDKISIDVGATAMHTDLRRTQDGYVYIQHLLDVIADGTYNFTNPSATPQSVQDYLTPTNVVNASSDQYQLQATLGAELLDLPGGPLQLGLGGSIRYEAVDAPSGNSDINGPTERYFTLNAFGTKGHRTIYSAFAELKAPIIEQVELSAAGRYDKYSSGQDAFSPKFGVKFRPIRQVVIRGTYSKGFRIPSFGEANALPTTGYVSNSASLFNNAYLSQYGANCTVATFTQCPTYIRSGSYGQTTLASPNLKPEKSRSFTAGIFVEPISNVSFSVDFYDIKKTGAITQPSNAPALDAYYNGEAIPAGYTVIADAPDPNFPNAKPRVAFVQSQLINANTIKVRGLDFEANASYDITDNIKWSTNLVASYIIKLETVFPDGTRERYDGTLGNFNLTAGNGTQKWKGTWINTLDFGNVQLNGTVNYFDGYDLSAMDQGTGYKDCGLSDGTVPCHVKSYITFDTTAQFKVNDKFTFYATVLNVFNRLPPLDPVTYGAHLYNAVQGGTGIYGRYFKAGVKFGF